MLGNAMGAQRTLAELLDSYEDGLYTDGEVIAVGLHILAMDEAADWPRLWATLPLWVRVRMREDLRNWTVSEDYWLLRPALTKEEQAALSRLKDWLASL